MIIISNDLLQESDTNKIMDRTRKAVRMLAKIEFTKKKKKEINRIKSQRLVMFKRIFLI